MNYSAPPISQAHKFIFALSLSMGGEVSAPKNYSGGGGASFFPDWGCTLGTSSFLFFRLWSELLFWDQQEARASGCGLCCRLGFHIRTNKTWPPSCSVLVMGNVRPSSASDFIPCLNVSQSWGKSPRLVFIIVLTKTPRLSRCIWMHTLTRQLAWILRWVVGWQSLQRSTSWLYESKLTGSSSNIPAKDIQKGLKIKQNRTEILVAWANGYGYDFICTFLVLLFSRLTRKFIWVGGVWN